MTGAHAASLGPQLLGQMADALAWPLLVLRPDGLLVHANLAARQLLRSGTALQLAADCRVRAAHAHWQPALTAALAAAGAQRPGTLQWSLPGAAGAALAVLTLAPLAGPPGARGAAPVLLTVTQPGSQAADLSAFAQAHTLTDAETRVLHRLAQAESSPRAAQALGVAQATVRSQTASLRRKTGHSSGADLVRALALLPPTAPRATGPR